MKLLNEKLDDFQEKPRNRSEPKLKYVPSPDLSPTALAEAEPHQRQMLLQKRQEERESGEETGGYFTADMQEIQIEKIKFKDFIEYRSQFELSQQVRIQTKQQELKDARELGKPTTGIEADEGTEEAVAFGIPYLQFDLMDPRQIRHEIQEDRARKRGKKLDKDLKLKICDLGNGCWTYHQFSTQIQTRQYRSPEVIIGAKYDTSADMWSFACMLFEMATGDFLFEPRKGANYGKDDDHLAQMMELLGRMPKSMALGGRRARRFFNRAGELRRIKGLNFWPLKKVLVEKYKFNEREASAFADFLEPMLAWDPDKRESA